MVNWYDALVIDCLWVCHDKRVRIPGTEDMEAYQDYLFHIKESVKGQFIGLPVCALVGVLTALFTKYRRSVYVDFIGRYRLVFHFACDLCSWNRRRACGLCLFYEPAVQEKVVKLGLTTKVKIERSRKAVRIAIFAPVLILVPGMVYFVNGARGFWDLFIQMTAILWIEGLFDHLFIDWYWVGKTKAWIIPGTEDLLPYTPKKALVRKWVATIIGYPMLAAILSGICLLF